MPFIDPITGEAVQRSAVETLKSVAEQSTRLTEKALARAEIAVDALRQIEQVVVEKKRRSRGMPAGLQIRLAQVRRVEKIVQSALMKIDDPNYKEELL